MIRRRVLQLFMLPQVITMLLVFGFPFIVRFLVDGHFSWCIYETSLVNFTTGNVFTSVCYFFCPQVGGVSRRAMGQGVGIPACNGTGVSARGCLPRVVCLGNVWPGGLSATPNPTGRQPPRWPLKQVVHILLKCILVFSFHCFHYTGREQLIRSHSSARFCFELSGNSN